jgi:deoxyribonuclease-4
MKSLRIGIHTSISGSLEKAALKAAEVGANTFQIFSASPRMWRASMPAKDDVAAFRRARERLDLRPLAIHVNYLINLASIEPVIREKSIAAFRGEMERAAVIGAEYLVTHPGSYRGQPLEQAIAAFVLGLAAAASGGVPPSVTVLLENTAGSGAHIGCRLEELQMIRALAARETDLKIGYCLDTCHLLAAGFDIASETGLEKTVGKAEGILGMENVKVITPTIPREAWDRTWIGMPTSVKATSAPRVSVVSWHIRNFGPSRSFWKRRKKMTGTRGATLRC